MVSAATIRILTDRRLASKQMQTFITAKHFTYTSSSKDLEVIKEQNASLQIHVLHLQEEINESQGKIRKVRDVSRHILVCWEDTVYS